MGEMTDMILSAYYDYDYFEDYKPNSYNHHYSRTSISDPEHYSRIAAVCTRCHKQYDNLVQSVAQTAKNARKDGWKIIQDGTKYKWYCPNCKIILDKRVNRSFTENDRENLKESLFVLLKNAPCKGGECIMVDSTSKPLKKCRFAIPYKYGEYECAIDNVVHWGTVNNELLGDKPW